MRVETSGLPTNNWHHFLRLRDLRQILSEVPLDGVKRVLEIGAGDGVQTAALREIFPEVVSMDIAPSGVIDGLVVADVSNLPFGDDYFDLVFSSNVLEHVESLDDSLNEMKRVLVSDGMMIHSMPTGTWKFLQIVLRPMASAVKIFRKLMPGFAVQQERARSGDHDSVHLSFSNQRSLAKKIAGQFIPTVHGISQSHCEEFSHFQGKWWAHKFHRAGLQFLRCSPLFLHSPYDMLPYRFLGIRDRLGRHGICSVQVFWLRFK